MDYPNRLEWQTRCEFNAYCKHTLRNELIDACRESKSRRKHEVNFSDLAPHEEKQLYTVDRYFVNEDEDAFCAGGLKITAKLLAEAMHSLPEEKRQAVCICSREPEHWNANTLTLAGNTETVSEPGSFAPRIISVKAY